ncbi:MAG: O-acetyl-ADP-ribose deacetylase [Nitrospirae bacterium]|nr:MAG: O-acetyl-ADP-ribose deacetylase [Nitrospirota bacterium]
MERRVGETRIVLLRGDITRQEVDAIVNAANSSLMGGGGVDGAIHRAGGPEILEACKGIVARQGRLPAGQAVVTPGGKLPARWVVHTVGPVYRDGRHGEAETLASCYRTSLERAAEVGARSVCFPSISTGAYRYPVAEAAKVALATVVAEVPRHRFEEVRFCLFSDRDLATYEAALAELLGPEG